MAAGTGLRDAVPMEKGPHFSTLRAAISIRSVSLIFSVSLSLLCPPPDVELREKREEKMERPCPELKRTTSVNKKAGRSKLLLE